MKTINLSLIAGSLTAYHNCIKDGKKEWEIKHRERIEAIFDECLPHGSGIDDGVKFDWARSNGNKMIFSFGFHHMDDNGYYDGWTHHVLTVTPEFQSGFKLRISGPNRRQIKDYLYDLFYELFYCDPDEEIKRQNRERAERTAFAAGQETVFEDLKQTTRCAKYASYDEWIASTSKV